MAETAMNKIAAAAQVAKEVFSELLALYAVKRMADFALDVIKAAATLQDLSIASGLSVATLSALSVEAQRAGTDIEYAAGAFEKMEKQALLALEGNKKSEANFRAIGITAKDLAEGLKDPDALIVKIAQHLEEFNDKGYKSAIMQALFSRSGAQMIEILDGIAKHGLSAANTTADQAEKAKALEVAWTNVVISMKTGILDFLINKFLPVFKLVNEIAELGFKEMGTQVAYAWNVSLSAMETATRTWATRIGGWLDAISAKGSPADKLGEKMRAFGKTVEPHGTTGQQTFYYDQKMAELEALKKVALDEYDKSKLPPGSPALDTRPDIPVPKVPKVPKPDKAVNDGLLRTLDERLKIIGDAIKLEDEATKLGNQQLDKEYELGNVSLSDYSTQKNDILTKSNALTQSLYAAEVAMGQTTIAEIDEMLKKKISVQRRAQLEQEKLQAMAKTQQAYDAGALDKIKNDEAVNALDKRMTADSYALAKSYVAIDIAYAKMNGDTEEATRLSIQEADGLRKKQLALEGNWVALDKLIALEERQALEADRSGWAGMTRAMIDYKAGLLDVGRETEAMTTKMLGGMEDALVNFVHTGKLEWKSLIDSMIVDLIRLVVRQQIMGGIASWLSMGITALSGVSAGGGGAKYAAGGPVIAGQQITVGERGPEQFVPSVAGAIVPNGASSGGGIVYSPTIQIDARSDRAQVQAETAQAVREGQKELVILLQRYNPGLRI